MYGFEYLKKFLQEEGFRINKEENFFTFKFQGKTYIVFENKGPYLQIVTICDTSRYSLSNLLEICNKLNSEKFILKFIVNRNDVWCSYEFMPTVKTTVGEFESILEFLGRSIDEVFEKLK